MHEPSIRSAALTGVAACAVALSIASTAVAGSVRFDAACAPVLTGFDRALYEKAGEGTNTLRRYIESRRVFLQQDAHETGSWASAVDEARKRCLGSTDVATTSGPASSQR